MEEVPTLIRRNGVFYRWPEARMSGETKDCRRMAGGEIIIIFQMSREQDSNQSPSSTCQFITKLALILEKQSDVISFSEDGTQVIIHDERKFTNELLIKYFRHDKWRSFVRQMNMYNFKKINRGVRTYIFVNPYFTRGNSSNYHLIRRKGHKNRQESTEELANQKEEVLDQVQIGFGQTSISQFLAQLFIIKGDVEECFSDIKKSADEISKKRKTNDTKHIMAGIKETIQIVEESSNRLEEALEAYRLSRNKPNITSLNHMSSFSSNLGEKDERRPMTNLIIPQALHPSSDQRLRDIEIAPRERATTMPTGLGIQLNSFSSFSII